MRHLICTKSKQAFTFIETVVVLGVLAIALPTLFSILFLILQQQAKIIKTQDVKRQGDTIYNAINSRIRSDAAGIFTAQNGVGVCTSASPSYTNVNGTNFYLQTLDGNWFSFERSGTNMFYHEAIGLQPQNITQLNTSSVTLTNFTISCARSSQFSSPLVSFSFNIANKSDPKINFTYKTKVKLRN